MFVLVYNTRLWVYRGTGDSCLLIVGVVVSLHHLLVLTVYKYIASLASGNVQPPMKL